MPQIFDYYGARDSDRKRISDLISEATGLSFEYRESSYIGTYYKARGEERGQEMKVVSNELEDDDGISLRWREWADYKTVVYSMDRSVPDVSPGAPEAEQEPPSAFVDDLRAKLSGVGELTFLRRHRARRLVWPGRPIDPNAERSPGTHPR